MSPFSEKYVTSYRRSKRSTFTPKHMVDIVIQRVNGTRQILWLHSLEHICYQVRLLGVNVMFQWANVRIHVLEGA